MLRISSKKVQKVTYRSHIPLCPEVNRHIEPWGPGLAITSLNGTILTSPAETPCRRAC